MRNISQLCQADIAEIAAAFSQIGWNKPASLYERYLSEQTQQLRTVLLARLDGAFAGYVTLLHQNGAGIPEIQDLNVLPEHRCRGLGTRLLDEAEILAARTSSRVAISVGLTADYGSAQRLYVRRGYLPDGRGLTRHGMPVEHGETTTLDDNVVLNFTKDLG